MSIAPERGSSGGRPRPPPHSAIAYHPDANDIWVAANYPSEEAATNAARGACGETMRDDCKAVWQRGSGFIGAARTSAGSIVLSVHNSRRNVQAGLDDACKDVELGCTPLGIFASDTEFRGRFNRGSDTNIRSPRDLSTIRNIYAASSWLKGPGDDGSFWVASGHRTREAAQAVALSLCQQNGPRGVACELTTYTGQGVLLMFRHTTGSAILAEANEARAREALTKKCRRLSLVDCKVVHIQTARQPGTFQGKF
jgi:Domain of unknown function (DUF4189)